MALCALAKVFLQTATLFLLFPNPGVMADDVSEDARLGPAHLMRKYGYNVEVYKVATEDGYILEVDRIPPVEAKNCCTPVLLVPGIMANAGSWVANLPHQSAGFLLADAGFDVWFVNRRGVPESNFHKSLTTSDREFWKWSFEEAGMYDLSATIDFVLNATGFSKLGVLTVSQGFTASLVLLSMCPEYNDKVKKRKNLVRYDYGAIKNMARYGQATPPVYPLEKITAPVALFRGMGDIIADPKDVEDLSRRLRHVLVMDYVVPDEDFTHQDFLFGYNATDILHRPMISLLKNFTTIPVQ
ncbi:lipase 1-like [Haemaphysalis longicornis]